MTEEEIDLRAELYGQAAEQAAQTARPYAEKQTALVLQRHGIFHPSNELVEDLTSIMLWNVKAGARAMIKSSIKILEQNQDSSFTIKDHHTVIANLMLENDFISANGHKVYLELVHCWQNSLRFNGHALHTATGINAEEAKEAIQELIDLHMIEEKIIEGERKFSIIA